MEAGRILEPVRVGRHAGRVVVLQHLALEYARNRVGKFQLTFALHLFARIEAAHIGTPIAQGELARNKKKGLYFALELVALHE